MTTVAISKQLTVSRTEAWGLLRDMGGIHRYNPFVKESPLLGRRDCGIGTIRRCVHYDGTSMVEEVTGWVEGRSMDIKVVESPMPVKSAWAHISLSDVRGAAQVTMTMNYVPKWGFLGQLFDSLVLKRKISERIKASLDAIDEYLRNPKQLRFEPEVDVAPAGAMAQAA